MREAFLEGGWTMYATLVFGLALLAVAVRYALRPAGRFIPLLASLGITTLASGTLGFVSGVIETTHALPELAERADVVVWLGIGQSLNNLAFALLVVVVVVVAAVAVSVGAWRAGGGAKARERQTAGLPTV